MSAGAVAGRFAGSVAKERLEDRTAPFRATITIALALLAACAMPTPAPAAVYRLDGPVVGRRLTCVVKTDDSLFEIGRRYDVGYAAIAAANPGVDPFVPDPGRRVVVPTEWILPDVPARRGIVINIAEMRLFLFSRDGRRTVTTFPTGIGDEGRDTPVGKFSIVEKIVNPAWHVPKSIREEEPSLPAVVPAGPNNPMGSRALRLSLGTVLIHGTNRPWGIGTRNSHGCIRLYEEDIVRLFEMVDRGTPVTIVNQPVKVAAVGQRVYLQVHNYPTGRDVYREALALLGARKLLGRVDPAKIRKAAVQRRGLVVDVSR